MKTTSHLAAVKAVAYSTSVLIFASTITLAGNGNGNQGNNGNGGGNNQLIPTSPTGWLTAFPTVVQTGTKPTLTWSITYPANVTSCLEVNDTSWIRTLYKSRVEIRVIGSGVTTGGCAGKNTSWVPAQAQLSLNGAPFSSIFYGNNLQVNPDQVVWSKMLQPDQVIQFGGRYYAGGSWSKTYNSLNSGGNVRILRNGEIPPTAYDLQSTEALKPFMAPYLDGDGRISIGPMDMIVMMELTQDSTNMASPCYNLQDLVLLVTCLGKNNNGHGNNVDGVDVSNPGNGHGGPNGQVDPSGTVDDEKK
ncbi:MAG: hypothetical protein AB8D78_15470 [Akkermansiaceae bacterium]